MPVPPWQIYIDHTKNTSPSKTSPTADLQANMQSNFIIIIIMLNTQYVKYHI